MFKNIIAVFTIIIYGFAASYGQEILSPVVKVKSHPTLEIEKIMLTPDSSVFYMNIKNQLDKGGYFCVNRDVYITIPGSKQKYNMVHSQGIENCPQVHRFNSPGESVSFRLVFPPLPAGTKEVDMIENCDDHCFYLKGIVLDPELNAGIKNFEKALILFRQDKKQEALVLFEQITENEKYPEEKHYAYSLYIVPLLYLETGNEDKAKNAFYKLKNSSIKNKEYFIDKLRDNEFFKSL